MDVKRASLILATLLFVACDPFHGVMRRYEIQGPVEFDCVESVLAETPSVSRYSYSVEDTHNWIGPKQKHVFSYEVADRGSLANLIYYPQRNGFVSYYHSFGCIACSPPQEIIDVYRPVMLEVESRLEKQCDLRGLPSTYQDSCTAVRCDSP